MMESDQRTLSRVIAERDAARAEVERLKEDCNGNSAGLLYWNRRYVETQRQLDIDVAAKDAARAELAALQHLIETLCHEYDDPMRLHPGSVPTYAIRTLIAAPRKQQ